MNPNNLPVGTKIRITDRYSHYYNCVAWIEDDNWIDRIDNPSAEFIYYYYVITPDNEDIEHGYTRLDGFEVIE